jgi:hypothetical protein
MRGKLLFAFVAAILLCVTVTLGARAYRKPLPAAQGPAPTTEGITIPPTSLPALAITAVEPTDAAHMMKLTLRNDSGRAINGFVAMRNDAAPPKHSDAEYIYRIWTKNLEPQPLQSGATTEMLQESGAPFRVAAVAFEDGEVIGDSEAADRLKNNLDGFEQGLRRELPKMRAALNRADRAAAAEEYVRGLGGAAAVRREGSALASPAAPVVLQAKSDAEGYLAVAASSLLKTMPYDRAVARLAQLTEDRLARTKRVH